MSEDNLEKQIKELTHRMNWQSITLLILAVCIFLETWFN